MRVRLLFILALLLGSFVEYTMREVDAQTRETIVLDNPIDVNPGARQFRFFSLIFQRGLAPQGDFGGSQAEIRATFAEVNLAGEFIAGGRRITCGFQGSAADLLLNALNQANLTTLSLERRLMARCQQTGQIGTGKIESVTEPMPTPTPTPSPTPTPVPAPTAVSEGVPGNDAVNVPTTNTKLTWTASAGATSYDVHFGTENPPLIVASDVNATEHTISVELQPGTTYFWQVIAKNVTGATPGPVWTFTTASP